MRIANRAAPLVAALMLAACGIGGSPAPAPPSGTTPTPTSRGITATGPYAVLATVPFGGQPTYTLSIVDTSGLVAASVTAATRSGLSCTFGQGAGVVLPFETVSATDDRAYYLDGNTTVRWLSPDGKKGQAGTVPGGGTVGSTFAVSPDDRRIAVVSADYSQNPIPFRIYLEDVGGGNRTQIFSASSGTIPWALGWHEGQLVLGYAPACSQGGGPFSAYPREIHLVDPATAVRSATLGSASTCPVRSLPSTYGVLCQQPSGAIDRVGWDGQSRGAITFGAGGQYNSFALSPGGVAAACCDANGEVEYGLHAGADGYVTGPSPKSLGFIDDSHLLLAGDTANDQPRIYDRSDGLKQSINVLGDFLARLPGGL